MSEPIWFWQNINSPHMAGLAEALAIKGIAVTYVAKEEMTLDRKALGWQAPEFNKCEFMLAKDIASIAQLVASAPADSIHVCEGIRGNGLISHAQTLLARRKLQQWVIMEMVNDHGWGGIIKRAVYRYLFNRDLFRIEGVLATGNTTPEWLVDRGVPAARVFPFTYFLPEPAKEQAYHQNPSACFRFIFVGQFIERKRLRLLIEAISKIRAHDFKLVVVGSGPLEDELHGQADKLLGKRLIWLGRLMQSEVLGEMRKADCLVLPSGFDGWGAVVSESLMVGTPAIVSDRCGSAGVVKASSGGGVFKTDDLNDLLTKMNEILTEGRQTIERRHDLIERARCLGAEAGANYLNDILEYHKLGGTRPSLPWLSGIKDS